MDIERGGIVCTVGSQEIYLDPQRNINGRTAFVSHAHLDHLPPSGTSVISSDETRFLAELRGIHLEKAQDNGFTLVDAGHILGSRGLLIGDLFYTGDICTRDRAFMRKAQIPKCKTLITECTFGKPEFSFPTISEVVNQTSTIIAKMFERGRPVILMGYELGKAQILTRLFEKWQPLYVADSVKVMNDAYRTLGIDLCNAPSYTESEHKLANGPWVMVTPAMNSKNKLLLELKSKYDAVTVGFSGWAGSNYSAWRRSADYGVTMSDHCDFDELVAMVKSSGAQTVYTTHGFADEFSSYLNSIGINAHPLSKS